MGEDRRVPTSDGQAWLAEMYGRHGVELYGFARRLTADSGLAEEIVQDVFVRAWRARDQFDRRKGSLRTWLFQIARNACIDAHRARSVRPALAPSDHDGDVESGGPTAADTVDSIIDRWLIEEALRQLSPEHRTALVMVHLEGHSYAEVSAAVGAPVGTVKSRVFHGLRQLRQMIEQDELFGRWST